MIKRLMAASALLGVLVAVATGQNIPATLSNYSTVTTCAEERNVVFVLGGRPGNLTIRATHPVYEVVEPGCVPHPGGCTPGDPGFAFTPEQKTLFENADTIVEAFRDAEWWRNRGMRSRTAAQSLEVSHRFVVRKRVDGTQEFAEVLTIYADGTLSLKPHPRAGTQAVCEGTVVVLGPLQVHAGRHYAQIDRVTYLEDTGSIAVDYAGGGAATIALTASRSAAVARVRVSFDTRVRPFAAVRSMFVSNTECDAARVSVKCSGRTMHSGPVLDAPDSLGDNFHFSRTVRSEHAQSAPNVRITVDTPVSSVPDFNGDRRADLVFQRESDGTVEFWHMDCLERTGTAGSAPAVPPGWRVAAADDFNDDGDADLLLRNYDTGGNQVWLMNGATRLSIVELAAVTDTRWRIVGTGDFDDDGDADVVWRHAQSGQNLVWIMSGAARVTNAALPTLADIEWQVGGVGDFDGDGWPDLLWRNCRTRQNAVWRMVGVLRLTTEPLPSMLDARWSIGEVIDIDGDGRAEVLWRDPLTGENVFWFIMGTTLREVLAITGTEDLAWQLPGSTRAAFPMPQGDLDGDCSADIVFRNRATGANWAWLMRGTQVAAVRALPFAGDTRWQIAAVQDFSLLHRADLLWRNSADGRMAVWFMNGLGLRGGLPLPAEPDLDWGVAGAGDFDGDGDSDIVWRHGVSGLNRVWLIHGVTLQGEIALPTQADPAWCIEGVGDFNLDRKPDLLWRNAATGVNVLWLMDGAARLGTVLLPALPDTGWTPCAVRDYDRDGDQDVLWRKDSTGEIMIWIMRRTEFEGTVGLPSVPGPDILIAG